MKTVEKGRRHYVNEYLQQQIHMFSNNMVEMQNPICFCGIPIYVSVKAGATASTRHIEHRICFISFQVNHGNKLPKSINYFQCIAILNCFNWSIKYIYTDCMLWHMSTRCHQCHYYKALAHLFVVDQTWISLVSHYVCGVTTCHGALPIRENQMWFCSQDLTMDLIIGSMYRDCWVVPLSGCW